MRCVQAALLLAVSASPALAQGAPEIVIPGRPGVPVYINGIDASWGIVEGEFGLDRPGMTPTVIYRPYLMSVPYRVPGYYPVDGRRPRSGRLEIVPPRDRVPRPAPRYYHFWSSESAASPVTEYPPYQPMLIAPTIERRGVRPEGNHTGGGSPNKG